MKIRGGYDQFTRARKKVANCILSGPKKVLFMSIAELVEACGVGDTSMFRFYKTMNCKGHQELRTLLSLSLHEGKQGFGQMESDVGLEDPFSRMVGKVLSSNIKALKETHSLLREDVFWRVVECFHKAGRICFYGVGTSVTTAMKTVDEFLKIEPKVYCASDPHMRAMVASTMSSGEVTVIFFCSEVTKGTIHVTRLARQVGAAIAYVIRFIKSPLMACADLTLLYGANGSSSQAGSSSAEIGQPSLIDMLYTEYYRTYCDGYSVNSEKTSTSVMEKLC